MDSRQKCLICGSSTEVGFVLDWTYGGLKQEEWGEGKPERSFWQTTKTPERRFKVLTLRCTKCGYLMEFADPGETSNG